MIEKKFEIRRLKAAGREFEKILRSLDQPSNFNFFSRSLEQFFLTIGQNNFGNKIPFLRSKTEFGHYRWHTHWKLNRIKGLGIWKKNMYVK